MADEADWDSLIPRGGSLELLVTATDFAGFRRFLTIQGAEIKDRTHRRVLRFRRDQGVDDFDSDGTAGIAFAARATASFPGAFPPVTFASFHRDVGAPGAPQEIAARLFPSRPGESANDTYLMDGGVLDNFRSTMLSMRSSASRRPGRSSGCWCTSSPTRAARGSRPAPPRHPPPRPHRRLLAGLAPSGDPCRPSPPTSRSSTRSFPCKHSTSGWGWSPRSPRQLRGDRVVPNSSPNCGLPQPHKRSSENSPTCPASRSLRSAPRLPTRRCRTRPTSPTRAGPSCTRWWNASGPCSTSGSQCAAPLRRLRGTCGP